jgi:hypothetical protein
MERAHRHGEFRLLHRMRHAQPMLSHMLDMRRPGIDECHILAGLHHVRAGITADRTRSDKGNFFAHAFLPASYFSNDWMLISRAQRSTKRSAVVRCRTGIVQIPSLRRSRISGAPLRTALRPGNAIFEFRFHEIHTYPRNAALMLSTVAPGARAAAMMRASCLFRPSRAVFMASIWSTGTITAPWRSA